MKNVATTNNQAHSSDSLNSGNLASIPNGSVPTFIIDCHPGIYRGEYRVSSSSPQKNRVGGNPIHRAERQYHGDHYRIS
jgi:hypothetical protein